MYLHILYNMKTCIVVCIVLFLLHFQKTIANLDTHDNPPEVITPLGRVQGSWKVSYDGRRYTAFEGIPYAKPPIGYLRFEEPQPIEKWIGTWNATKLYRCYQNSLDLQSDPAGEEDCLYINIYVPKEVNNAQQALDVVIHIHGGGFMFGSGNDFMDPKYVMDRDVILVTFNYRLGSLGFLSTADEVSPGNNGLKDQVLALKWVQQNIGSFGGNPNSVTLTGFSAGAASTHFHYFSPLSKGLFHRGMSISGVATGDWAIEENPLETAKKLASMVGCPTNTNTDLVECLKTRPASLLIQKTKEVYAFPPTPGCLFKPVIEKKSKRSFLSEHPYKLLVTKNVLDVPWITSFTRDDGLIISTLFFNTLDELNKKWTEIATYVLDYPRSLHRTDIPNKIRDYYVEKGGNFNFKQFTKIATDKLFALTAESASKLQSVATKSPVYVYYFNYDKGENSFLNLLTSDKTVSGVSHGDDMVYFFGGPISRELSKSDIKLKNACLDMLYHYARTGVPKFEGVEWLPTNGDKLTYLNITSAEDIKLQDTTDITSARKFWKEIGLLENKKFLEEKDEL